MVTDDDMEGGSVPPNEPSSKAASLTALLDFPESLESRIESMLVEVRPSELAKAVASVSRAYTRERETLSHATSSDVALRARLAFFLPRDLLKLLGPLHELGERGLLPKRDTWRVLDLGAGLGTTSLGLARYAALSGAAARLSVRAIDRDAGALATFRKLAAPLPGFAPMTLETHVGDLRGGGGGPFDVILLGLSLNELAEGPEARAILLETLVDTLSDDGVILVIEPALRETAQALTAVRDVLVTRGRAEVLLPCTHARPCPMRASERDWCHAELPIELPDRLATIARDAGLRTGKPTYAPLVLARPGRGATSTDLRAVSAPLPSKGKLEQHACGPEGLVRLVQLDRERRSPDLDDVRRGARIALDPPLEAPTERVRLRERRLRIVRG